MTDRAIVYTGALPQTVDLLNSSKFTMLGDAFLALATLGNDGANPSTTVMGLACAPTAPASLLVNVGPGCIFAVDQVDATAYSDLGTDANQIFKMGIREATNTLSITPPGTIGYSQVYLVQAILSDVDSGSTVLSYYNAANPQIPLSGPSNSGTSQFTTRTCVCTVSLKAGVAATTGTQANPAPDAGFTPLFYITVANGQTQITSGNIARVNTTRWVWSSLPDLPANIQKGSWITCVDTGTQNNLIISPVPPLLSYQFGDSFVIKAAYGPSGPSVINVSGLGNVSIVASGAHPIEADQWSAGDMIRLTFDGTYFQLSSPRDPGSPVYLTINKTFYVNASTGSNSNDGLAASTGGGHGPWATLQYAANFIRQFNLNGFNITINVANGSYAGFSASAIYGSGAVSWIGNPSSPSSVTVTGTNMTAASFGGPSHSFNGFKVQTSGSSTTDPMAGIAISGAGGHLLVNNIEWGACIGPHNYVYQSQLFAVQNGNYNISGGSSGGAGIGAFVYCTAGSFVNFSGSSGSPEVITITGNPHFGSAFLYANGISFITWPNTTFSGSATGSKYALSENTVFESSGAGVNYLPGDSAGSTASGAQYL